MSGGGACDLVLTEDIRDIFMIRLNSELEDQQLLLPHYLYSGAKHIAFSAHRPFHFFSSIGALFVVTRQTQNLCSLEQRLGTTDVRNKLLRLVYFV